MICDDHGNQLCDGLSQHVARPIAQQWANTLGDSVWFYGPDDTDETATEFTPESK